MTNRTKSTKTQIEAVQARIAVLTDELNDTYTISLGPAAVKCVRETLDVWTAELARLEGWGTK